MRKGKECAKDGKEMKCDMKGKDMKDCCKKKLLRKQQQQKKHNQSPQLLRTRPDIFGTGFFCLKEFVLTLLNEKWCK